MPTVYLPLGSAAASGQMGEMVIYQGVTVRKYVIPTDPRTQAQIDIRNLFFDVTKTLRTLGLFGRGVLAGLFGPRWYTMAYQRAAGAGAGNLAGYDPEWDAFTLEEQDAWRAASPFVATYSDPGQIFYSFARVLQFWVSTVSPETFLSVAPAADNAAAYRAAWDVGLENVLTSAKVGHDDARLIYTGTWTTWSHPQAFIGSLARTVVVGNSVKFYFRGNRVNIGIYKSAASGVFTATFSDGTTQVIDEYMTGTPTLAVFTKDFLNKGVHWVKLTYTGNGAFYAYLDYIDCESITGGTITVESPVLSHSRMGDLDKDDHPHYFNQPRGDARYSLLSHVHGLDGVMISAELDFGDSPSWGGVFEISIAGVTPDKKVICFQSGNAATGKEQDENELDALLLRGFAGADLVTVYADVIPGPATGSFKIELVIG